VFVKLLEMNTKLIPLLNPNKMCQGGKKDREISPPGEISTVYACASFVEPTGAETGDDYSFVMAVSPQHKVSKRCSLSCIL